MDNIHQRFEVQLIDILTSSVSCSKQSTNQDGDEERSAMIEWILKSVKIKTVVITILVENGHVIVRNCEDEANSREAGGGRSVAKSGWHKFQSADEPRRLQLVQRGVRWEEVQQRSNAGRSAEVHWRTWSTTTIRSVKSRTGNFNERETRLFVSSEALACWNCMLANTAALTFSLSFR